MDECGLIPTFELFIPYLNISGTQQPVFLYIYYATDIFKAISENGLSGSIIRRKTKVDQLWFIYLDVVGFWSNSILKYHGIRQTN